MGKVDGSKYYTETKDRKKIPSQNKNGKKITVSK